MSWKQRGIVLDLDGTLWKGERPINGAVAFWDYVRSKDIPTVLLTNSGERSAADVATKFHKVLNRTVDARIICTALDHLATVLHMKTHTGFHVFVIASNNAWYKHEFAKNASLYSGEETCFPRLYCFALFSDGNIANYYALLVRISQRMTRDNVCLYATSADDTLMMVDDDGNDFRTPGPGLFLLCLSQLLSESARKLIVPLGKGCDKTLAEYAVSMLQDQGFDGPNSDVYFVGDRLNTDVRAALQIGCIAVHVQSGCHNVDHYPDFPFDSPHVIATDISDMSRLLARNGAGRFHDVVRDTIVTKCHQARRGDLGTTLASTMSAMNWRLPPRRASSFPDNLHELASFLPRPKSCEIVIDEIVP
jgi:HAD superfamily hydrolase (TIGR01450 family)